MLVWVLVILAFIITGFIVYISKLPDEFSISRELLINAPAHILFPYINSSEKSHEWMPWMESDPHVKIFFSGPEQGLGSTSSWDSVGKMGTGKAVVIESVPDRLVRTQLTYTRPMEMSQVSEITLSPSTNGTLVRWSVTGRNAFMGKMFSFLMNMDKMVGSQFEQGLTKLKNMTENK